MLSMTKSFYQNPFSFRYPYEAIRVVTADGYVLLMERMPRFVKKPISNLVHFFIIMLFIEGLLVQRKVFTESLIDCTLMFVN